MAPKIHKIPANMHNSHLPLKRTRREYPKNDESVIFPIKSADVSNEVPKTSFGNFNGYVNANVAFSGGSPANLVAFARTVSYF